MFSTSSILRSISTMKGAGPLIMTISQTIFIHRSLISCTRVQALRDTLHYSTIVWEVLYCQKREKFISMEICLSMKFLGDFHINNATSHGNLLIIFKEVTNHDRPTKKPIPIKMMKLIYKSMRQVPLKQNKQQVIPAIALVNPRLSTCLSKLNRASRI